MVYLAGMAAVLAMMVLFYITPGTWLTKKPVFKTDRYVVRNMSLIFKNTLLLLSLLGVVIFFATSGYAQKIDMKSLFNSDGQLSEQQVSEFERLSNDYNKDFEKSRIKSENFFTKIGEILDNPAIPLTQKDVEDGIKIHDQLRNSVLKYVDSLTNFAQKNSRPICHESTLKYRSYVEVVDSALLSELMAIPLTSVQNRNMAAGLIGEISGFMAEKPRDGSVDTTIGLVLTDLVAVCIGSKTNKMDFIDGYLQSQKK